MFIIKIYNDKTKLQTNIYMIIDQNWKNLYKEKKTSKTNQQIEINTIIYLNI